MKINRLLLIIFLIISHISLISQEMDFSRLSFGTGFSTYDDDSYTKKSYLTSEFMLGYTYDAWENSYFGEFMATNIDFAKPFKGTALGLDFGGLAIYEIGDNMLIYYAVSILSLHPSIYHNRPFGSSMYMGFKVDKLLFDSRIIFWNWHKGKDPIFRQDSKLSIHYFLFDFLSLSAQVYSYTIGNQFYTINLNWYFGNH